MRPSTINSPAGGMSGWAGNQPGAAMSRLNVWQDRALANAPGLANVGGLPGKGGGSTPQSVPGGNALAGLFMGNSPAGSGQPAAMLPTITQPRPPIVDPPAPRRPLSPAPREQAPLPRFNNLSELMSYNFRNPGKLSPELVNNWKRSLQRTRGSR